MAMGFFAKSPEFSGGRSYITIALFFATIALSTYGFWVGLQGARRQRTAWSWLAPGINAFILLSFLAFFALIIRALERFQ